MRKLITFIFLLSYHFHYSQLNIATDINKGNAASHPEDFFEYKGELYFSALITEPFMNNDQYKIWKTDGTTDGTVEVSGLEVLDSGKHYFTTDNYLYSIDNDNYKIIRSDAVTSEVIEVNNQFVEYIVGTHNNFIYYLAYIDPNVNLDKALYKSNEDATQITLLKTFPEAEKVEASDSKDNISVLDSNKLIIFLETDTYGNEPYITDGTEAGTQLLKNITTNDDSTESTKIYSANNFGVFVLNEKKLWATDGTENGTLLIKEFTGSNSFKKIRFINYFNNKIYFAFNDELWETNGTEAGTVMVFDNINGDGVIEGIINRGNDLLILTSKALHIFDGNSNTTTRLNTPNFSYTKSLTPFKKVGNKYFFNAFHEGNGFRLWVTDGTENGTNPINPFWTGDLTPQTFQTINNKLVFTSGNYIGAYNQGELWVSDGTNNGTALLKDINKSGNLGSFPQFQTELNGKIYFAADDNIHGIELFVFDGTNSSLVKDIKPGIESGKPHDFYVINNKIIFKAYSDKGLELWETDGTENGTKILKDINPTGDGFQNDNRSHVRLGNFVLFNSEYYFFANDGVHGMELWKTNGTEAGTVMVKNINTGANSCYRPSLDLRPKIVEVNNELYFYVATSGTDNNLSAFKVFKTDGTTDGTVLVNIVNDFIKNESFGPRSFFSFNNNFYFYARERTTNKLGIYRTDVSNNIIEIPNVNAVQTTKFYPTTERVYYTYNDNMGAGLEFWAIEKDDSVAIYRDIIAGSHSSSPTVLFQHQDYLYFKIINTNFKPELWRMNDTTEPEVIISETSNNLHKEYSNFTPYQDNILIHYSENINNSDIVYKMKVLNSTSSTLTTVFEVTQNIALSNLYNGFGNFNAFIGDNLYFTGHLEDKGEELLTINLPNVLSVTDYKNEKTYNISLYPNPTNNFLNIKTDKPIKEANIYNLLGKKVLTFKSNIINISNLKAGIYLLKVKDSSGSLFTKKWIKK